MADLKALAIASILHACMRQYSNDVVAGHIVLAVAPPASALSRLPLQMAPPPAVPASWPAASSPCLHVQLPPVRHNLQACSMQNSAGFYLIATHALRGQSRFSACCHHKASSAITGKTKQPYVYCHKNGRCALHTCIAHLQACTAAITRLADNPNECLMMPPLLLLT